uniref:Uncharacterized protein n=1 Tax=Coccidioides posadasii RMSCC 3488 TaxID=454284 RepID=A0A0J6FGG9_COCPO|nr:hypothetical protein CPAG_05704 [Coccidioides posadasii RMSCC 3488]
MDAVGTMTKLGNILSQSSDCDSDPSRPAFGVGNDLDFAARRLGKTSQSGDIILSKLEEAGQRLGRLTGCSRRTFPPFQRNSENADRIEFCSFQRVNEVQYVSTYLIYRNRPEAPGSVVEEREQSGRLEAVGGREMRFGGR